MISEMIKYSNESTFAFTVNEIIKYVNLNINSNYFKNLLENIWEILLWYTKKQTWDHEILILHKLTDREDTFFKVFSNYNKENLMIIINESCFNRSLKTNWS